MKRKIFAVILCALITAISVTGSVKIPNTSYEIAYILGDIEGGY